MTGDSLSGSVTIHSLNPWQGAEDVTTTFTIFAPDSEVPSGVNGIAGPAERLVVMSSSQVAMLDELGALNRLVGLSGLQYITNPTIKSGQAKPADLGYDSNFNYELLASLNPDAIILYGVDSQSLIENKIRELGIPFLYFGDYLEDDPVGRAEWIVAMGYLTGLEDKAIDFHKTLVERYSAEKAQTCGDTKQRQKVLLNAPYNDSWFIPGPANYLSRLISDAGGTVLRPEGKSPDDNTSSSVSTEEALLLGRQADVWINPGSFHSLKEISQMLPLFSDLSVFNTGRVANFKQSVNSPGNDFYESGVLHPDLILRELRAIFLEDSTFTNYRYFNILQ